MKMIEQKLTKIERSIPPSQNFFGGGIDLLIFFNFCSIIFIKKSQVIQRIPDLEKKFHDYRTSYDFRIIPLSDLTSAIRISSDIDLNLSKLRKTIHTIMKSCSELSTYGWVIYTRIDFRHDPTILERFP